MAGNGWEQLDIIGMAGNGWKLQKIAKIELAGNGWKWLEISKFPVNCWK